MTYSFVGVEDVYVPIAVIIAESREDGSCSFEIGWSPGGLWLYPLGAPLCCAPSAAPLPGIRPWRTLALFLAIFPFCLQEMGALVKLK